MSHRRALVTLGACLLAAAPAHAARRIYGSSLSAPAAITETHGADTAFWPLGAPAPDDGQILEIRLKGTAVRQGGVDPLNEVHFQSLRPAGDGTMVVQASTAPFYVPVGGD